MSHVSMVFGVILMLLGGGLYFSSDSGSITSLIPAFFGIGLLVLGFIARNDAARKHAMHLAAMLGLIGCVFPAYRVIQAVVTGAPRETAAQQRAFYGSIAMAVLCGIFLALCVKSFIDVRRARKARESQAA